MSLDFCAIWLKGIINIFAIYLFCKIPSPKTSALYYEYSADVAGTLCFSCEVRLRKIIVRL